MSGLRRGPIGEMTFTQAGTGASEREAQAKMRDVFNVFDVFTEAEEADALTGTPAIDTTTKIQTAIDDALGQGKRCEAYGTFYVSSKIVFKGDADFSQATFHVYDAPAIAVEVSSGSSANPTTRLRDKTIWLPHIVNMDKPASGWAGQGVGARIATAYSCKVYVGTITDFARNLVLTSYGTNGCVYNEVFLGHLENGEVNLDLSPGDVASWVNENNIYGGRYSHESSEGTSVAGTRHIRLVESPNAVNNNLFIKPSIEGDTAEYHVENAGSYNQFLQARWESTTPKVWYRGSNTNYATRNVISYGYRPEDIVYTVDATAGGNNVVEAHGLSMKRGSSAISLRRDSNFTSDGAGIYGGWSTALRQDQYTADNYSFLLGCNLLKAKRTADVGDRFRSDFQNGRTYYGPGTGDPTLYVGFIGGSSLGVAGNWVPEADNTRALGGTANRWANAYATNFRPGDGTATWTSGAGTPEGSVSAVVGSFYTDITNGVAYMKKTGSGNTGWKLITQAA